MHHSQAWVDIKRAENFDGQRAYRCSSFRFDLLQAFARASLPCGRWWAGMAVAQGMRSPG